MRCRLVGDVFILGAGFSKAVSDKMLVLNGLNELVDRELKNKQIPIERTFPTDLEMELTQLAQGRPWTSESDNLRLRAQFLDLVDVVRDVLTDCTKHATRAWPCDWLIRLIRWWNRTGATVVTFNYDTLVERGIIYMRHPDDGPGLGPGPDDDPLPKDGWSYLYPIGLTPAPTPVASAFAPSEPPDRARFKLLKLHGSINWFYSGQNLFLDETIYYVGPYRWMHYELEGPGGRRPIDDHEKLQVEWVSTKQPMIVPPLAEKSAYFQHRVIRGLWGDAAKALRAAERVFCLGYSLPGTDTMVRFLLHGSQPQQGTPFYIVNKLGGRPNTGNKQSDPDEIVEHFRQILPSCYSLDTTYVSSSREDEPIPRLVDGIT